MKELPVYVMTANQTMKALQAFAYLFNEFWSDKTQVNILGYNMPDFELPNNFNYISLGIQRGKDYWSDDMKDYLSNHCKNDLFIYTFEDALILNKIDKQLLEYAYEFCTLNMDNLLRFNLTGDLQSRGYRVIQDYNDFQVIEANQDEIFRLSLQPSIWNKKQFLQKLEPKESMHRFENPSKRFSRNDGLGVYGFGKKHVLTTGEGYRRGKKCDNPYLDALNKGASGIKLDKKYIDEIEKNNWLPII